MANKLEVEIGVYYANRAYGDVIQVRSKTPCTVALHSSNAVHIIRFDNLEQLEEIVNSYYEKVPKIKARLLYEDVY